MAEVLYRHIMLGIDTAVVRVDILLERTFHVRCSFQQFGCAIGGVTSCVRGLLKSARVTMPLLNSVLTDSTRGG